MSRLDKYIRRLTTEWITHQKIIIGVDFDSTLSPYHSIDNMEDIQEVISVIKDAIITGAYVVIHTACNPDRYSEITNYCKSIGIVPDSINMTPIDLPYGKSGSKPYCNIFLDDRAGLLEAILILKTALYCVRGKLNITNLLQQQF